MSPARAIVTGASSGIGLACAEALAKSGRPLLLAARRRDRLEELAGRLRSEHDVDVAFDELDVRDRPAVDAWAEARADLLAESRVLVNNAGLARGLDALPAGSVDDWDEMLDTNVKGLLNVTRRVVPHFVTAGAGDVVNIGSVAGRWVYPKGAVYCASKHAERAINEGLRLDLNGTGVRVATVDPGMVETEFSLVRFHGDDAKADSVYDGMTPLSAEDVAATVAWIVDRPAHVNVAELVLLPTDQASPTVVHRRK
ncbi:MAG: SDR family NAD(P)-dependent oxidoreductase [Acidobacteriota bacterium]